MYCSVLQCVALCCSVLHFVAVCCSVLQPSVATTRPHVIISVTHRSSSSKKIDHTATHCTKRHHTAPHGNTLQHTATHCTIRHHTAPHGATLQHNIYIRTCDRVQPSLATIRSRVITSVTHRSSSPTKSISRVHTMPKILLPILPVRVVRVFTKLEFHSLVCFHHVREGQQVSTI